MQTLNRINITSHASSWLEIFNLNEFNQQKNKKQKRVHSAADADASLSLSVNAFTQQLHSSSIFIPTMNLSRGTGNNRIGDFWHSWG